MVEPVRHRRTKGAATDMLEPKATASHLDSAQFGSKSDIARGPKSANERKERQQICSNLKLPRHTSTLHNSDPSQTSREVRKVPGAETFTVFAQVRRALGRNHLRYNRRNPPSIYAHRMRQLFPKLRLCPILKHHALVVVRLAHDRR